jgi:hypothetical protein
VLSLQITHSYTCFLIIYHLVCLLHYQCFYHWSFFS